MLALKGVSAGYETNNVIHDIDLDVAPGEIVALVGANGAGKSTLVKTISGLLRPRAGAISFVGQRIEGLDPRVRVRLGIAHVPEGRQVFGGLSVRDNLRLGAYVHRRNFDDGAMEKQIESVCAGFPALLQRLDAPAANLSGGQQQMLAIARGLMAEPRLLVLDEPSLGLAPALVSEIFRLIAALRAQGRAILLAEQNARLSLAIADRGYVVENGRITLSGTGRVLLDDPAVAERYLGVGKAVGAPNAVRHQAMVARLQSLLKN